jgi:O-antigen ligase
MGDKADRYVIPALIGLAPALLLLLTWGPDGMTVPQVHVRGLFIPILAAETLVIVIALRAGFLGRLRAWRWPLLPTGALLLLLAIAIGTAIAAPAPVAARTWTAIWLLHLGFGVAMADLTYRMFNPGAVAWAYVVGSVPVVVGLSLFALSVDDPDFDWTSGWPAANHIRHLGYYFAAAIALSLGLIGAARTRTAVVALAGIATACFAFALWTGSRGAVVGVAGGVLGGLVLVRPRAFWTIAACAAGALGVGTAIASVVPAPGPLMGVGRMVSQTVESGEVTTGRTAMWLQTVNAISRQPLFGYGEAQMPIVSPFDGLFQPHQVLLQVALAWGLIGLLCAAFLAIWFLLRALPVVRNSDGELLAPFLAMLVIGTIAMFDNSLFNALSVSIFAACAGMIASRWPSRASAAESEA